MRFKYAIQTKRPSFTTVQTKQQTKRPSFTTVQTKQQINDQVSRPYKLNSKLTIARVLKFILLILWKMWWALTITNTVNKDENINGAAAR